MQLPESNAPEQKIPFGLGFPIALTRFAQRFPKAVLVSFVLVGAVAGIGAAKVKEAEDLLDFIPPNDPDVKAFKEVGKTFGALRVALVGIEAKPGEDVFTGEAIKHIAAATDAIKNVKGIDSVDSITNVEDFTASETGAEARQLVEGPPQDEAAHQELRKRALSRDHIVGNFVSKNGDSTLIMAYLADGASDRLVSHQIREAVQGAVGDMKAVYGGAPFAASAIYEETQGDVRRLTPIAVFILLALILIAFRDVLGVLLTIVTTAWSVIVVMGAMALIFHEPFTAASATLPVILFASGTSYAVHVLGRYYILEVPGVQGRKPTRAEDAERLLSAVRIVGPPVAIAAFTTAAGFLACEVMDIRPMRAFGVETAAGVIIAMIAALLVVPATLALWPRGVNPPSQVGRVGEVLASLAEWSNANRKLVLGIAAVLAAGGLFGLRNMQVRMEPRSFFRPGSDPWLAEKFLSTRFGGSQILMVSLSGDFADPASLHEIKRLEQFARSLPDVTQAIAIVEPISMINEVMGGGKRLPETKQQVQTLLFFLEGRPSLKRLQSPERDRALVHIRVQGEAGAIVKEIEQYMNRTFQTLPAGPTRQIVAERIRWATRAAGDPIADEALNRILDAAKPVANDDARLAKARGQVALALLTGDNDMLPKRAATDRVTLPDGTSLSIAELSEALGTDSHALEAGSPRRAQFISTAPSPEEGELAWNGFVARVAVKVREISVEDALKPAGPVAPAAMPAIREAIGDLFPAQPFAKAEKAISWSLAGEPILERGMSRSVELNHKKSMIVAWVAVLAIIWLLFRSMRLALISVIPSALTTIVLFGGITLLGFRVDLGTSLVTCIATGAGSEFAVQYLWYLKRSTPRDVVRFVGPIMVISTLLIAAGFAVLGFGNAQPMRLFGSLAALAMVGSAALTFLLVPAMIRTADTHSNDQDAQPNNPQEKIA